ncbi:MAG: hypothetical protein ACI8P3_000061 [Saprospiraceae bacterium]|jgi:hypothetical protein
MKYSKIFIIAFINLFLLLPVRIAVGCGPQLFFDGYTFINPDIIDQESEYSPYFFYFGDFYEHFEKTKAIQTKSNLEEWKDIFCDQISVAAIGDIIYNASISDIKLLRTAINNKNYPLSPRLKTNAFARHLKKNNCTSTVDYLLFAKECEPHVSYYDEWDGTPNRDTFRMQELIDIGLGEFRESKSNYIKLRYAYQLIRLAHYKKNYPQTLELYDYLLPKFDPVESILNYWIMGHKAGALIKTGHKVQASYLFSLIFENCPSKRESAYRSFNISSENEWQQALLLCQDDRERATLYAIRASSESSRATEEMEKIYSLYPESPNLELLLVKEIIKLEKDLLGSAFNDKLKQNIQFFGFPRKQRGDYVISLHDFVKKCIAENKVRSLPLWKLADGYLEFLAGDFYAADQTFSKIEKDMISPVLKEQLEVFRLALKINSFDEVDNEDEKEVEDIMLVNPLYKKYKDFPDFLNDRLAFSYKAQGNPGKAFRVHYPISALKPNPQIEIIDDLLAVCRKEKLSKYERALITKKDGTTIESDLMDMKGTLFMALGNNQVALEVFKKIPRNEWDKYQFNPFIERLEPCIECPLPDSSAYLNKPEVIEKIFELEYKARSDFENGATYYYQLGTAYYNMSYFGHSWMVTDYYRSGANWTYDKDGIFPDYYSPFGNRENQDLTLALSFFEKCSINTKDPELAAKAAFMAARCELNQFFVNKGNQYNSYGNKIPDLPAEYRRYYQLLKENYSQSIFYQEMIQECKFFAAYVR